MSRKQLLHETAERLDQIERLLDKVFTALVVRDPGTALSSESYEGLRRQVISSAQERLAHLVQLAEIDIAIRRGASVADLALLSSGWLRQAGVEVVDHFANPSLFESTDTMEGVVVTLPAYVDTATDRLLRQGRLGSISERNTTEDN